MSQERIKQLQYFVVLNFRNDTCKRSHDTKRDGKEKTTKYSCLNDTAARICHKQNRHRSLFQTFKHFIFAQFICV